MLKGFNKGLILYLFTHKKDADIINIFIYFI